MPQIPVYTPSQRIDASAPVNITSGREARGMGEAVEGFGGAIAKLGDVLDGAARKADAENQKYAVAQSVAAANVKMMTRLAEASTAQPLPEDDPKGFAGATRYAETVNADLQEMADELPENIRGAFLASAAQDSVTYTQRALAQEVAKKEKGAMEKRQGTFNTRGMLARNDPSQTESLILETEHDLETDQMLSPEAKQKMIYETRQSLVKATVDGYVARGDWNSANKVLTEKYGKYFSPEELRVQSDYLKTRQNQYYDNAWQAESRRQTREGWKRKEDQDTAMDMYLAKLNDPSANDNMAIDPVMQSIDFNFNLPTSVKTALKNKHLRNTTNDEAYSIRVTDDYMKMGAPVIDRVRNDAVGNSVSLEGGARLRQNFTTLDTARKQSPEFDKALKESFDTIKTFGAPDSYDPQTGVYRKGDDSVNARARTAFLEQAAEKVRQGKGTPNEVNALAWQTLKAQYSSQTNPVRVDGIGEDVLTSTQTIQAKLTELAAAKVRGEYNTPEKLQKLTKQVQGLRMNQVRAKFREELSKHSTGGN